MSKILTLKVPEEVYQPLVEIAQQRGQSPEEFAIQGLIFSIQHFADDPVEPFIGSVNSNIPNWTEKHDRYLGEKLLTESRNLNA